MVRGVGLAQGEKSFPLKRSLAVASSVTEVTAPEASKLMLKAVLLENTKGKAKPSAALPELTMVRTLSLS